MIVLMLFSMNSLNGGISSAAKNKIMYIDKEGKAIASQSNQRYKFNQEMVQNKTFIASFYHLV